MFSFKFIYIKWSFVLYLAATAAAFFVFRPANESTMGTAVKVMLMLFSNAAQLRYAMRCKTVQCLNAFTSDTQDVQTL